MKKNNSADTLKTVLHYTKKYRLYMVLSLVMAALTVAFTLYVPILTGQAIDRLPGKGMVDFAAVFAIIRKIAVLVIVTAVAGRVRIYSELPDGDIQRPH